MLYDDESSDKMHMDNRLLQAVTCILQTETDPLVLIDDLPQDVESLTLIQGAESGNKTISFSYLDKFSKLIILELHGINTMNEENDSNFYCEIDTPLPEIKYLNFEKILLKVPKEFYAKYENEVHKEIVVSQYIQQSINSHALNYHENSVKEILPYNKYIQEHDNDTPLFLGYNNLILLRISNCQLSNVNWEMFDGLHNLQYLILEKNNLKFIPDFAFYSTPNLKSLSLSWNKLLNIRITDLAGLLELEYLDLSHNNFSQLSELSFPPFPKLKLADFGSNPISVVFPSTFEVMNTTDSLILGGNDTPLTLMANSFIGLKMLKKLTLTNLVVTLLKRELLTGMPNLNELVMSGNITELEFDAFLEVFRLQKLIISQCSLQNISMDSFIGLERLKILDLSHNLLEYLNPGTFDPLKNLKELYLHNNKFSELPRDIFLQIHPKLIRLNQNQWHCSCKMSEWKPIIINKIKRKSFKGCSYIHDKHVNCNSENKFDIIYVFDSNVAPKCTTPRKFYNWNVFHVMRKQLKCAEYKPKIRKRIHGSSQTHKKKITSKLTHTSTKHLKATSKYLNKQKHKEELQKKLSTNQIQNTEHDQKKDDLHLSKLEKLKAKLNKHIQLKNIQNTEINSFQDVPIKISLFSSSALINKENNNLNTLTDNSQNLDVEHKTTSNDLDRKNEFNNVV